MMACYLRDWQKTTFTMKRHADIVRNFGAPSREVSDGAEGGILVYEDVYTTLETDQSGSTLTTTKKDHRNFKEFSLGPDDICYNVWTNEKMADGKQFSPETTLLSAIGGLLCGYVLINGVFR